MSDVFPSIIGIVRHTPLWVWVLYAALLLIGFQRTRDSILPLWRLLILPIAVVAMTIASAIGAGVSALPAMPLGLVVGGVTGWCLEPASATQRLPDGRVALRGEWWTFVQIFVVLVFRYVTNVAAATSPLLNADRSWQWFTLFASALLSAVFLGRVGSKIRTYSSSRLGPQSGGSVWIRVRSAWPFLAASGDSSRR